MIAGKITEDNLTTVIIIGGWLLLVLLTAAAYLLGSMRFAAGVLAGGVLALANFFWLRVTLRRAFHLTPKSAGRSIQWRYLLRFSLTALIIYALIVFARVDLIGLLLGLSLLVIVITVLSFYLIADKGE